MQPVVPPSQRPTGSTATLGTPPPSGSGASYLPALDGLRGLAVLLVLFSHAGNAGIFLHPALDLRGTGRLGVFLFFVLSSFLLVRLALLAGPEELRRPRYWAGYSARRVARVMPPYLAALAAYGALTDFRPAQVLQHALLLRGEGHFWTVPVEMRWYTLLPAAVLVAALLRRLPLAAVGILLGAAVLVRQVAAPDYGGRPPEHWRPLLPFVPIFLMGAAGAVIHGARNARPGVWLWEAIGWSGVAGLLWHFPSVRSALAGEPVEFMRYHLRFDALGMASLALVLGTVLGAGGLRRIFLLRPLRFVGRVSFSLYLMHPLVIAGLVEVTEGWPEPLPMLVLLGGSLAIAWLFWRWIERPCISAVRSRTQRP